MPTSTNRTYWPVGGGALALQPGWFPGHSTALIYVNIGLGEVPENMSHPVVSPFQITGPTNNPYPGTICLPQVPLPANISVKAGDKATIQVVETAKHGAALYNVCFSSNKNYYLWIACINFDFRSASTLSSPTTETPRSPKSTLIIASTLAISASSTCTRPRALGLAQRCCNPHDRCGLQLCQFY
jgi:hypothetical protein